MPVLTNNFPGIGYSNGRNPNYFQKFLVTATGFGSNSASGNQPDGVILFANAGFYMINEDPVAIVEVSFTGNSVDLELNPTLPSRGFVFESRVLSKFWLRLQQAPVQTATQAIVSVAAWKMR
jgi:hypothetical protein